MDTSVKLAVDARASLGEGSLWDADKKLLYWVNINAGELHIFDPATGSDRTIEVGQQVTTVVPSKKGDLVLGLEKGIGRLDPQQESLTIIADYDQRLPSARYNDGKCDPAGRFWVGTISADRQPDCHLFCLEPDLSLSVKLDNITNSNGIIWSPDQKTMYYIDTPTRRVDAFDFDAATGAIDRRRPVVTVPPAIGKPDGMTIDSEGMLWVCLYGGGAVGRWDPATGQLVAMVRVPAPNATSCAFGGENLDELYITTARQKLSDEELEKFPHAGGVFVAKPGVTGVAATVFAG